MTLILTAASSTAAWLSADNMVSRGGKAYYDDGVKLVSLNCPEGSAVISFTGLAEAADGTRMADWIRQTLRGANRLIEHHVVYLAEMATREIGRSRFRRQPLHFGVIAARDNRMWYYEVTNAPEGPESRVDRRFEPQGGHVEGRRVYGLGKGASHVRDEDKAVLGRVLHLASPDPQHMRYLLAAVNGRVATRVPSTVSRSCTTAYINALKEDGPSIEAHDNPHSPKGAPSSLRPDISVPHIYFGMDFTDTANVLRDRFRAQMAGTPMSDVDYEAAVERAERDMQTPRHGQSKPPSPS